VTAVVLRAEDAHVVRDGRPILAEVSLTVRAGEHWALLGANGAGKSTLLGLLGALVHPTRGSVEVLGCAGTIRTWRRSWSPTTWRSFRPTPRTPCCCARAVRSPAARWPRC
jgi:ABC-type molybdenum transport system ATPase subunit/photorepair protein PhrA